MRRGGWPGAAGCPVHVLLIVKDPSSLLCPPRTCSVICNTGGGAVHQAPSCCMKKFGLGMIIGLVTRHRITEHGPGI
jgi:hypothetical protein